MCVNFSDSATGMVNTSKGVTSVVRWCIKTADAFAHTSTSSSSSLAMYVTALLVRGIARAHAAQMQSQAVHAVLTLWDAQLSSPSRLAPFEEPEKCYG